MPVRKIVKARAGAAKATAGSAKTKAKANIAKKPAARLVTPVIYPPEPCYLPYDYYEEGEWVWDRAANDFVDQIEFHSMLGGIETFCSTDHAIPKLPKRPSRGHRPVFQFKVGIYQEEDPRNDEVTVGHILSQPVFKRWIPAQIFHQVRNGLIPYPGYVRTDA